MDQLFPRQTAPQQLHHRCLWKYPVMTVIRSSSIKTTIAGSDATITADVVGGSYDALVNSINAHSTTTGITAKAADSGQVVLTKADGTAFGIAHVHGRELRHRSWPQTHWDKVEQEHVQRHDGDGASSQHRSIRCGSSDRYEDVSVSSAADKYSFKVSNGDFDSNRASHSGRRQHAGTSAMRSQT